MIKKCKQFFLIFLLLLSLPTYAYADAGTPLMWVAGFHLLFGNAIVGIFEGILIAAIFRVKFNRSIFIMILANYLSMVAGCFGIFLLADHIHSFASIYNLPYILSILAIASYLLTILLEWPFTYWILKGKENRRELSLKANLIAQTASYVLLILIYLSCSGISLITKTNVDKSLSFLKTRNVWIYFLSPNGDALYKIRIDGADKQKIEETGIDSEYTSLFVCNDNGQSSLTAHWYENNQNHYRDRYKILLKNLLGAAKAKSNCDDLQQSWYRLEPVDFRPENERDWKVHTGTWAIEGLSGKNKKTGKSFWIALETPFIMWPITHATILPGQQVICEIGDQIAVVDINTLKIGLITFGQSPTIVLGK